METSYGFGVQLLRLVISLAFVLGVLALAVYGFKRLGLRTRKAQTNAWIQVLAQHPVGIKHQLLLVKVQSQLLLLGVSPQGVQFLTLIQDNPEPSPGAAP